MTAGRIILDLPNPAFDYNGELLAGALLKFCINGTATLQNVYTDPTLVHALRNPLPADASGRFPEVWADTLNTFSVLWTDPDGVTITTFDNVTPAPPQGADLTLSNLSDYGASRTNLGLGTAAVVNTGTSLHTLPFLDGNNSWSGTNNFIPPPTFTANNYAAGYLILPVNLVNSNYAFVLADSGLMVQHTSGAAHTWTISPDGTTNFPVGSIVNLNNIGAGVVTVARGAAVALRLNGNATDADRSLGQWCDACVKKIGANSWLGFGALT